MDIDALKTDQHYTAMICNVQIEGKPVRATIDSGAATSVMTSKLMKRLGEEIDSPSKIIITTITGDSKRSLGVITKLRIKVNGTLTPIDVEVIEEPKVEKLILGNDYLSMVNATIKYNEMKVVLYPKTQSRLEVDVDFYYNESDPENYTSEEESETEYESEDSDIEEIQIHDL